MLFIKCVIILYRNRAFIKVLTDHETFVSFFIFLQYLMNIAYLVVFSMILFIINNIIIGAACILYFTLFSTFSVVILGYPFSFQFDTFDFFFFYVIRRRVYKINVQN